MKFTLKVTSIKRVVSLLRDVVPARSVSKEGTGILMDVRKDRVIFSVVGTDTILRLADLDIKVEEEGRSVVNSSMFSGVISTFTPVDEHGIGTDVLTISSDVRKKALSIVSKTTYRDGKRVRNKRTVKLLNSELFPSIPKFDQENAVSFPGIALIDAINKTYYAASYDQNNIPFNGISIKAKDGIFTCVATDGIKLARYKVKVKKGLDFETIVPIKCASKISKAIDPLADVKVLFDGSLFWASSPGVLVGGYTLLGEYPEVYEILPKADKRAVVDRRMLLDNVKNLDFSEDERRVSLNFNNSNLVVSMGVSENEDIPVEFKGKFKIDFDLKFLKSSLQSIDGNNLFMDFSGPTSPAYFYSTDVMDKDTEFKTVLVPLK